MKNEGKPLLLMPNPSAVQQIHVSPSFDSRSGSSSSGGGGSSSRSSCLPAVAWLLASREFGRKRRERKPPSKVASRSHTHSLSHTHTHTHSSVRPAACRAAALCSHNTAVNVAARVLEQHPSLDFGSARVFPHLRFDPQPSAVCFAAAFCFVFVLMQLLALRTEPRSASARAVSPPKLRGLTATEL